MNRTTSRRRATGSSLALCLILAAPAAAQTVAPGSPAPAEESETLVLSPFTVSAEEDDGYLAKSTLAGTRVRTELKDVGSATSIVTGQFLANTNSKNSDDLLVYTTNTEVSGQEGNFAGGGDGPLISSNYNSPVAGTRVRGLAAADNLRDFFLTDIPWDSYNTGRVDLQRGANSILFGIGSPAGIINNSLNEATFKDANNAEFQFTDLGSYRGTIDLNKEIIDNQLAIRIAGLYDDTKYKQKPAFRDDHRM
jgi:outer membrane receptor protein involved in Fe transport